MNAYQSRHRRREDHASRLHVQKVDHHAEQDLGCERQGSLCSGISFGKMGVAHDRDSIAILPGILQLLLGIHLRILRKGGFVAGEAEGGSGKWEKGIQDALGMD